MDSDSVLVSDIDECSESGTCSVDGICTNVPGSFKCQCGPGYEGDGLTCQGTNTRIQLIPQRKIKMRHWDEVHHACVHLLE